MTHTHTRQLACDRRGAWNDNDIWLNTVTNVMSSFPEKREPVTEWQREETVAEGCGGRERGCEQIARGASEWVLKIKKKNSKEQKSNLKPRHHCSASTLFPPITRASTMSFDPSVSHPTHANVSFYICICPKVTLSTVLPSGRPSQMLVCFFSGCLSLVCPSIHLLSIATSQSNNCQDSLELPGNGKGGAPGENPYKH